MEDIDINSEDRYLALFRNMEQGFCIIEVIFDSMEKAVDYRFLEINPAFEKQTGLRNAVGKTMRELESAHEDHWFRIYGEVVKTGRSVHFENEAAYLAGGLWYSVFALPFGDPGSHQVAIFFYDITDRKKAQEALLNSEERQRSFIAASFNLIYRMSANWERLENLVGKEMFTDSSEPVTGWIDKYILPEDQPRVISVIQKAIATKSVFELEHRVIRSDGSVGWVHSRAIPLLNKQGEITEWFGTGIDVTERRRMEESLRKSEEKYRTIFETIDEGFCIYELMYDNGKAVDLKWEEVNPAYEKQTGLKNIVGKLVSDVMPNTEKYWIDMYDKVARTGEAVHFEGWHQPAGRWYYTFSSKIDGTDSKRVAVLFADITERKRREQQQEFYMKLADVLRSLRDPVAIQFEAARILGEHLGAQRVAYSGIDDTNYVTERDWTNGLSSIAGRHPIASYPECVYHSLVTGSKALSPNVPQDPDFSPEEAAIYASMQIGAFAAIPLIKEGQLTAIFIVTYQAPHVWTSDEIQLAEETAERTWAAVERARTEEALRISEAQLKQSLKLRDEFIGVASHELKTPVTSMLAFAEVVQERLEEAGNEQDTVIIKLLNAQIQRLTSLINTLLDTTRIAEGQLKMTFDKINISKLIEDRIEEIKRTTTHQFEFEKKNLPLVIADAERIGQVITNLLSNAIKYSPQRTRIYVTAEQTAKDLLVSVKDEGPGIARDEQEKIFDRFYRAAASNVETSPGMGLGLYITSQIIERHKGRIWVESDPGKGSTFFFTLPY